MHNPYSGLVGKKVVIVTIPREDIDSGNVAPALASLNKLVDSKEALAASNGTISLLVSGYDHDSRELHMIPEMRAYFKALDDDFPYWFHICTRIEHSLRMLFLMLTDLTPVENENATVSVQFANDDFHDFLKRHLEALDSIHNKHGFREEENERITELVMNYFDSLIGK